MRTREDLKHAFDALWNESVEILPTLLVGLLILIGGWLIATLISKIIFKLLERSKNTKVSKVFSLNAISEKYAYDINFPLIISKITYWLIFLFAIVAASETFGWHNVSQEISVFIHYIPRILSALLIFALGYTIAAFIRDAIKEMTKTMKIGIGRILGDVLFYFLLLVVSLTSISQAGINTSIISTHMYIILGALALTFAISFGWGAKEVVSDLLKNYYNRGIINQGDHVIYAGVSGVVDKVSKTSVVIQTEKEYLVIPAKEFYASSYSILKRSED